MFLIGLYDKRRNYFELLQKTIQNTLKLRKRCVFFLRQNKSTIIFNFIIYRLLFIIESKLPVQGETSKSDE